MFEWVSKKYREQQQQAKQEAELKQSLADKVKRFQVAPTQAREAFTEVTVNGKRIRVAREHITIEALSPLTSDNPTFLSSRV